MTKKGTAKSVSPLPKSQPKIAAVEEPEAQDYKFVLTFNSKAELVDVSSPQGMSLERAASHIAFVAFWLTDENAKRHEEAKK